MRPEKFNTPVWSWACAAWRELLFINARRIRTEHFNLAQSLRDVAALSAACLAMRRDDFFRVGGFDAVNTPIAHSDIDLCFKSARGRAALRLHAVCDVESCRSCFDRVEEAKEAARAPEQSVDLSAQTLAALHHPRSVFHG